MFKLIGIHGPFSSRIRLSRLVVSLPNSTCYQHFSTVPTSSSNSEEESEEEIAISAKQKFSKLGLNTNLINYMSSRFSAPTEIQERAIPILLKGQSAIVTSETGSGKTLAFLLPLLVRMQNAEQKRKLSQNDNVGKGEEEGVRVVIISPARELNHQLFKQAKDVSHDAKFKARLWGNEKIRLGKDICPDVVITSPSAYHREMKWNPALVEALVFDECDAMLFKESGFIPELLSIVETLKPDTQIICVGATALKGDTLKWLKSVRPNVAIIKSENVGALPHSIKVHMCPVKAEEGYNKHPALDRALGRFLSYPDRSLKEPPRCIVFCNSVASCRSTHHSLGEKYGTFADFICLHGEMRPMQRETSWENFTTSSEEEGGVKKPQVLVCTDLSSRGLDVQNIQHVVLFDIPYSLPDIIHRAGRTGRAGKAGEVTFVIGRGEKRKVLDLFNLKQEQKSENIWKREALKQRDHQIRRGQYGSQYSTKRKQFGNVRRKPRYEKI